VEQAAEFARYTGNSKMTEFCRDRFKTGLIHQSAEDGGFPTAAHEAVRLFALQPGRHGDCLSILSTPRDDLFAFETANGAGMKKAMEFMFPFIADKKKWPHPPDVRYFDD
jgi:Alginate lyase